MRRLSVCSLLVCLGAVGMPVFVPARAEAQLNWKDLASIRVLDPQFRPFHLDDRFLINIAHRQGGWPGIQIRIFRGKRDELPGQYVRETNDGCLLYFSVVLVPTYINGGLNFGLGFSEQWLRVPASDRVADQTYFVRFELAGVSDGTVKIRKEDVRRYFSGGYQFVVKVPEGLRDDDVKKLAKRIRDAQGRRWEELTTTGEPAICIRLVEERGGTRTQIRKGWTLEHWTRGPCGRA